MENSKRPQGRPPGRRYTHEGRVLTEPETWTAFDALAKAEGKTPSAILRAFIERYIKRRRA